MEVERVTNLIGDPPHAVAEDLAGLEHDFPLTVDLIDGSQEPDVAKPTVSVLKRQAAPLGELACHRLGAVGQDASEHTRRAHRHRKIGDPADADDA